MTGTLAACARGLAPHPATNRPLESKPGVDRRWRQLRFVSCLVLANKVYKWHVVHSADIYRVRFRRIFVDLEDQRRVVIPGDIAWHASQINGGAARISSIGDVNVFKASLCVKPIHFSVASTDKHREAESSRYTCQPKREPSRNLPTNHKS